MEDIKKAIRNLEQSLDRLETALLQTKKEKLQAVDKVDELKSLLRKTHERLNTALEKYHQEQGSE